MITSKKFKEQKYYNLNDYNELFKDSEVVNQLLKSNAIKFTDTQFKFEYVGVIVIGDEVLYCYPKYMENIETEDFKEILQVLKRFNKKENNLFYLNDELDSTHLSLLSLMLFFIEDYYDNGLYRKTQEILEVNGNGEIDWNRTINNTFPIIQGGKPYYIELQTRRKITNLNNYFKLLHECIITCCSKYLESKDLLDLFDLNSVNLSKKSLHDFGDEEYIKERLEKELKVEFNTHNRILLNAMISYVDEINSTRNTLLNLYGTNEYWYVWEEMCSDVLEDNLDDVVGDLFGEDLNDKSLYDIELKSIINYPILHLDSKNKKLSRFKPDLVIINKEEKKLLIFDAKYRNLNLNTVDEHLKLEDVYKQFLYELSYCDLIRSENIKYIKNVLLFPTSDDKINHRGFITFKMFSNIGLKVIDLIDFPAHEVNQLYLTGEKMDINRLRLFERDKFNFNYYLMNFAYYQNYIMKI